MSPDATAPRIAGADDPVYRRFGGSFPGDTGIAAARRTLRLYPRLERLDQLVASGRAGEAGPGRIDPAHRADSGRRVSQQVLPIDQHGRRSVERKRSASSAVSTRRRATVCSGSPSSRSASRTTVRVSIQFGQPSKYISVTSTVRVCPGRPRRLRSRLRLAGQLISLRRSSRTVSRQMPSSWAMRVRTARVR